MGTFQPTGSSPLDKGDSAWEEVNRHHSEQNRGLGPFADLVCLFYTSG